MEVQLVNRITATIHTSNGLMYVKDYWSCGTVVKLSLTDDESGQRFFVGDKVQQKKPDDQDCYGKKANYGPIITIWNILECPEMDYLQYTGITVKFWDLDGNFIKKFNFTPQIIHKKIIQGKRAEVIDEKNGKEITFTVVSNKLLELKRQLYEQQTLVREKIGTLCRIPKECYPKKEASYPDYYIAIKNCKNYVNGDWTLKSLTDKQAPYCAEFLNVDVNDVRFLNVIQASEILDNYFTGYRTIPEKTLREHYEQEMKRHNLVLDEASEVWETFRLIGC